MYVSHYLAVVVVFIVSCPWPTQGSLATDTYPAHSFIEFTANELETVVTGDFNSDSVTDVGVIYSTGRLNEFFLGDGTGGWNIYPGCSTSSARHGVVFDFDLDGDEDVIVTTYEYGQIWFCANAAGNGTVWTRSLVASTERGTAVAMGDLNGDGLMDLAVAEWHTQGRMYAVLNNGATSGWSSTTLPASIYTQRMLTVDICDLDNDGDVDILYGASWSWYIDFWVNDGSGTSFSSNGGVQYNANGVQVVKCADMNGDNATDILAVDYSDRRLDWYNRQPGGGWTRNLIHTFPSAGLLLDVADMNGDGWLDVGVVTVEGMFLLFHQGSNSAPGFDLFPLFTADFSTPKGISMVDMDGVFGPDILIRSSQDTLWFPHSAPVPAETRVSGLDAPTNGSTGQEVEIILEHYGPDGSPSQYPVLPQQVKINIQPSLEFQVTPLTPGDSPHGGSGLSLRMTPRFPQNHAVEVVVFEETPTRSPFSLAVALVCNPGLKVSGTFCVPCEVNSYGTDAISSIQECSLCDTNTRSPAGSSSWQNCTCIPGTWASSRSAQVHACSPCPTGGTCDGGDALPSPLPGFYQYPPGSASFVSCLRQGCSGDQGCAEGYAGFMCGTCAPGWYSSSPTECTKCTPAASGVFASIVVATLAFVLASTVFLSWSISKSHQQAKTGGDQNDPLTAFRGRSSPLSISLVVATFQIVGLLSDQDLGWSSSSSSLFGVFSAFNVDSSVVGTACTIPKWHVRFILMMLLFIGTHGAIIALACLVKTFLSSLPLFQGLAFVSFRTLIDSILFALVAVTYIPIASSTLVAFDCTRLPNNKFVLDTDNGVTCFEESWWSAFPFALLSLALFVLGTPAYMAYALFSARTSLRTPGTMMTLGSLYRNWQFAFFWGEPLSLLKRLAIVSATAFLTRYQVVQVFVLFAIFLSSLGFVSTQKPYFAPLYNTIDARLSTMLLVILMIGSCSYAERDRSSTSTFFDVITITALILLIVVALHAIVTDALSIYREKKGKSSPMSQRRSSLRMIVDNQVRELPSSQAIVSSSEAFVQVLQPQPTTRDRSVTQDVLELDQL